MSLYIYMHNDMHFGGKQSRPRKDFPMTNSHDNTNTTPAPDAQPAADRSPGYWLKMSDALISREYAARFAAEGVTRRDLRILSALAGATELPERLRERLERGGKRVWALAERGWIEQGEAGWKLTPAGEEARERLAGIVQETRDRITGSVSAEDLATTTATLEAIAREFGWTEDTRFPRPARRGFDGPRGHFGHRGHFGRRSQAGFGGYQGHQGHRGHQGHDNHQAHSEFRGHRGCGETDRFAGFDRFDRPGRSERCGHDHDTHQHRGFGREDRAGFERGRGYGRGFGAGDQGHQGHQDRQGHRSHGRGAGRAAAFERGFAAGFTAAQPDAATA